MKFALSNSSLAGLPFEEQCELAASLGYHGLMISPHMVSPKGDATRLQPSYGEYLLETAQFHGLRILGFENLLAKSENVAGGPLLLSSPDKSNRDATLRYLKHLAKICYAMEGTVMVLGSAKEREVAEELSIDESAEAAAEVLRELCATCEPLKITLTIDPIPYTEANFVTSAREAAIFATLIEHPSCGLALGTAALQEELNPETPGAPTPAGVTPTETQRAHYSRDLIHFHRERLSHFQVLAIPHQDLLTPALSLREIDYAGWISVRVDPESEHSQRLLAESLAELRRLCG